MEDKSPRGSRFTRTFCNSGNLIHNPGRVGHLPPARSLHCEEKGNSRLLSAEWVGLSLHGAVILRLSISRSQSIEQTIQRTRQPACAGQSGLFEQVCIRNLAIDFLPFQIDHALIMPVVKVVHVNLLL